MRTDSCAAREATGVTCLLHPGCWRVWRVRHVGPALCPAPEFSAPSLRGKDTYILRSEDSPPQGPMPLRWMEVADGG